MKAKLTKANTTPTLEVEGDYGTKVKVVVVEHWNSERMVVTVWHQKGKLEVEQQEDLWQK